MDLMKLGICEVKQFPISPRLFSQQHLRLLDPLMMRCHTDSEVIQDDLVFHIESPLIHSYSLSKAYFREYEQKEESEALQCI